MIVGGWADGYTNIALRSLPRMQAPTRLLLGPWAHGSPESCRPGPNIDFKAEMLRWFDRWLKGIDNGVDREPPIVVYQQRSTEPDPLRGEVRINGLLPRDALSRTGVAYFAGEATLPGYARAAAWGSLGG